MARGEISDEFGRGKFLLSRQSQSGFCDAVDFLTAKSGISAICSLDSALASGRDKDDRCLNERALEYRYSVITSSGSAIDYLKVHLVTSNVATSKVGIFLTWRGDGYAKLIDPDNQVASHDNGSRLRQNEIMELADNENPDCSWYLEVPSHSLILSVCARDVGSDSESGQVIVTADVVFENNNKLLKQVNKRPSETVAAHTGSGRISSDAVSKIIDNVEKPHKTVESEIIGDGHEADEAIPNSSLLQSVGASEATDLHDNSTGEISVSVSQKITVYHGEDIILGTEGMFIDRLSENASYLSANLPEWLFLDQKNGDLMGTVPVAEESEDLEFSIYAVDECGMSAKTVILIECAAQELPAGARVRDFSFCEGSSVTIDAKAMFENFEFDVTNRTFFAAGLPAGIFLDGKNGQIQGEMQYGSAINGPFEISIVAKCVDAAEPDTSIQFTINVADDEFVPVRKTSLSNSMALKRLYKMNRDSEQILVADLGMDLASVANCYSEQNMGVDIQTLPGDDFCSVLPSLSMFTPERYIYLQVHERSRKSDVCGELRYKIRAAGETELPDWIEHFSNGVIRIMCDPDRRYVNLEFAQSGYEGAEATFDVSLDTFEGKLLSAYQQSSPHFDAQLSQVSAA